MCGALASDKLCTDQFVTSTLTSFPWATPQAAPQAAPRHLNFSIFGSQVPLPPVPKSCSNALHVRPAEQANAPQLGRQDQFKTICYKYQLAFFI